MKAAWPLAIICLCAEGAVAQHVVGARAGTVHLTVGDVRADGQPVRAARADFPLLKDGQVLATGVDARAEVLLAPGVFLRLFERGSLRMADTRLDHTAVDLLKGTSLVEVVETAKGSRIQIRFGPTVTEFKGMGVFRFDADTGVLRVWGGEAEVQTGSQIIKAGQGKLVHLADGLATGKFDSKQQDEWQQWAARMSFDLYVTSAEARRHRTHWEMTATGWSWNRDFLTRFYSPLVAREFQLKQAREQQEKAAFQQTLDSLAAQDSQRAEQQQIQQQQTAPAKK